MTAENHSVQLACRVLDVSESGCYARKSRAPSPRAIRHAWLTAVIREIHRDSRGVYGTRRVHAELTFVRGVPVGHCAVQMLMARARAGIDETVSALARSLRYGEIRQGVVLADRIRRRLAEGRSR